MEHHQSEEEICISRQMDFIVPLKQIGLITRAVLEAIFIFYEPRRIIVVTPQREGEILMKLVNQWKVKRVEYFPEETYFKKNFNLSMADITAEYDINRSGDQREPGWWIQQLIKLGAATQIPNISKNYAVWDGDLVPTRRWRICEKDSNGNIKYFIAILQAEARSEFNTAQYALCMKALTGFEPINPSEGGTFVAHHMIFNTEYMKEMLNLMIKCTGSNLPWPLLIMSMSRQFYRFSEYKTYATFMLRKHPTAFHYHPLKLFGEGGMRFREANGIVDEMLQACPLSNGGLSYQQVTEFMFEKWNGLGSVEDRQQQLQLHIKPAYVQLDHVYGLQNLDDSPTDADASSHPTSILSSNEVVSKRRLRPISTRRKLSLTSAILSATNRSSVMDKYKRINSFLADTKPTTTAATSLSPPSVALSDCDSLDADTTTCPSSSEASSVWGPREVIMACDACSPCTEEGVDGEQEREEEDEDDDDKRESRKRQKKQHKGGTRALLKAMTAELSVCV